MQSPQCATTISSSEVVDSVSKLHGRQEDLFEGDLIHRISRFRRYTRQMLPVAKICLDEFVLNEDLVEKYAQMYRASGTYPPIVFDGIAESIIDGLHRANALVLCGLVEIDSWVGLEHESDPDWDPDWTPESDEE